MKEFKFNIIAFLQHVLAKSQTTEKYAGLKEKLARLANQNEGLIAQRNVQRILAEGRFQNLKIRGATDRIHWLKAFRKAA